MPLNRCELDGKPGWKWGDSGRCYVYTAGNESSEMDARKKAMAQAAAMGEFPGTGQRSAGQVQVETRTSQVADVNFAERIVEVIAVPYEQPSQTPVMYRGELWEEVFERGAFDGIESREGRVAANRDHDRSRTVGKVAQFWPSREEGLVATVKIGKTALGDETLALADEDMLSASIGFGVRGRDQVLNKRTMQRRIRRAFADHLAFVEKPAYAGADVLDVRAAEQFDTSVETTPLGETPLLDEYVAFLDSLRRK